MHAKQRYECFGWWLSDPDDINVNRTPKTDACNGVTCGQESQLDSEGSVTSGHHQNNTDVGEITFDLAENTTINKNIVNEVNTSHQTEYNAPVTLLSADTDSSKITVRDEETSEIAAGPLETSTASNTSIKCISDRNTRLQNYWASQVESDETGLSSIEKLALSIEHDPDRKLEESRCALLQTFRELDSRVRGLQEGARELQDDVVKLQQDFQVFGSLHIKYNLIPASLIFFSAGNRGPPKGGGGLPECGPPTSKLKKHNFVDTIWDEN
jgi:hypothetical protein